MEVYCNRGGVLVCEQRGINTVVLSAKYRHVHNMQTAAVEKAASSGGGQLTDSIDHLSCEMKLQLKIWTQMLAIMQLSDAWAAHIKQYMRGARSQHVNSAAGGANGLICWARNHIMKSGVDTSRYNCNNSIARLLIINLSYIVICFNYSACSALTAFEIISLRP